MIYGFDFLKSDFLDEITNWPRKSEILKIPDMKSAGVEIDPIPRGIIFSLLGFPGGHKSKKSENFDQQSQNPPHSYRLICREYGMVSGRGDNARMTLGKFTTSLIANGLLAQLPNSV